MEVDLSTNTTPHLIGDIERLRVHLGIDRWLVWGGSWGVTLGLAYAQAHPGRVTELALVAITSPDRWLTRWITRDMGRVFPREWERFRDGAPPSLVEESRASTPSAGPAYAGVVSAERDELPRLVEALPEGQVPDVVADVRRRLAPRAVGAWPPAWVGSVVAGRSDVARNHDDLLAEGFGQS